jgi:hypothetical protein
MTTEYMLFRIRRRNTVNNASNVVFVDENMVALSVMFEAIGPQMPRVMSLGSRAAKDEIVVFGR